MTRTWMIPRPAFAPDGGGTAATAPAAAPASSAAPAAASFHDQLPDEFRADPAFKDFKDIGGLAKSYLHAQKLIGRPADQVVALPAQDDAQGWNAVYQRLGRPEAPDKYDLKTPEGVQEDPAFKGAFAAKAHEAGLSDRQARALFDWYNAESASFAGRQQASATQKQTEAVATLKREWGNAYEQNLSQAKAALAHYGDADLVRYLEETRLGDDPRALRMFAKLGRQLSEDGLIGRAGAGDAQSPADAKAAIGALQADRAFMKAYTTKSDPGHADAVRRMAALYEAAHPAA